MASGRPGPEPGYGRKPDILTGPEKACLQDAHQEYREKLRVYYSVLNGRWSGSVEKERADQARADARRDLGWILVEATERGVTAREMAETLGIKERTVERLKTGYRRDLAQHSNAVVG